MLTKDSLTDNKPITLTTNYLYSLTFVTIVLLKILILQKNEF